MDRTDNFFVIHNFNTVPENLIRYCNDYIVYDCSDSSTKEELQRKGIKHIDVENTGHNITSYFSFFVDNYDNLPEVMCLLKGNMIGRHVSEEFFQKTYNQKSFTFLYDEKQYWDRYSKYDGEGNINSCDNGTFLAMENVYVEENTSWYVQSENHPKRYFNDVDDLLRFIYKSPMIPKYCMFASGACYIVRREQVKLHSKEFYVNLNKIMNYGMNPSFPSEAHQIERILPIIFTSVLETNEWMDDEAAFDAKLPECSEYIRYKYENRPRRFGRLRRALKLI